MARSGEASGRAEAVLTCPGEIDDPNFPQQCSQLLNRLQTLLNDGKKIPPLIWPNCQFHDLFMRHTYIRVSQLCH